MRTVYLDNNATTAVAPEVFEAMRPFYTEEFGNPSSMHHLGRKPAAAVRDARKNIASFLGCNESELVFTACGTESDNLAVRGILEGEKKKLHIITTAVEHSAVLNPFKRMKSLGHELTILGVDKNGMIDLDELRKSLRDETSLVSIMWANNETGVVFPIEEIAEMVRERGIPFHSDAVQAIGKIPVDLARVKVDMISMSAHKFHGPKGVGVLFVRKGTRCNPILLGGSQEHGRRPGTENVAGISAMAVACELAARDLDHYQREIGRLRDRFEGELLSALPDTFVNGGAVDRLPNTSSVCFRGVEGQAMLLLLDEVGICASAGSACKSGAGTPSHVLAAMGLSPEEAAASIRFSLGSDTDSDDISYVVEHVVRVVREMRESPRLSTGG